MTLSKKKQVQAEDDDNVYHIYRKKKVPDLLILLVRDSHLIPSN